MRNHFIEIIKEQNKGILEMNNLYQDNDSEIDEYEALRMATQKDFFKKEDAVKYLGKKS